MNVASSEFASQYHSDRLNVCRPIGRRGTAYMSDDGSDTVQKRKAAHTRSFSVLWGNRRESGMIVSMERVKDCVVHFPVYSV